jgi:hypothetical protein
MLFGRRLVANEIMADDHRDFGPTQQSGGPDSLVPADDRAVGQDLDRLPEAVGGHVVRECAQLDVSEVTEEGMLAGVVVKLIEQPRG